MKIIYFKIFLLKMLCIKNKGVSLLHINNELKIYIMIHYIDAEWNSKFIIAKTGCGIDWLDCNDFTEDKELVTCKKCLKKITK